MPRILVLMLAAPLLVACGDPSAAPGPAAVAPPDTSATHPITGTVVEHSPRGASPRPFFAFRLVASRSPLAGWDTITVASGADGRYAASVAGRVALLLPVEGTGFHAPCSGRNAILNIDADRVADFNVVSDSVLSTTGMPASLRVTQPYLSGRVIDSQTGRPVAGALVSLSGQPAGGTLTDAQGRYVLCIIPPGSWTLEWITVRAEKSGYLSYSWSIAESFLGNAVIDLWLASY